MELNGFEKKKKLMEFHKLGDSRGCLCEWPSVLRSENSAVFKLCTTQSANQDVLCAYCVLSARLGAGIMEGRQQLTNRVSMQS